MRKIVLLMFTLILIVPKVRSVCATSSGYERFNDDECEVFLEYLPIVPYNPSYPTASEEFPIKFHIWQNAWWHGPWYDPQYMVPRGFAIKVYYRDDSCGSSDYVTWKRWYPTSTAQYGLIISWSLSGGYGPLTVSTSVAGPDVFGYNTDYTEYYEDYDGKTYLHVGKLGAEYRSNLLWGAIDVYGGGSIGVPNDITASHHGHHILVRVAVRLVWLNLDCLGIPREIYGRDFNFILGDDIPSDTDCWITVQQGSTNFLENSHALTISTTSGGTTDPAPGTYTYAHGSSVTVTATTATGYVFDYWLLDGAAVYGNPITVTMNSDHTLTATFSFYYNPGPPACPMLFVWSGTAYAEEGLLDIHAESDVTVQHEVKNALALENGVYKLQLRELDNYTSHIDQVKLYAVDGEGEWHLCPLTYAYHSELGNVKYALLFDDSNRVDLEPTETIDLKFAQSIPYSQTAHFTFEINGYNVKWGRD